MANRARESYINIARISLAVLKRTKDAIVGRFMCGRSSPGQVREENSLRLFSALLKINPALQLLEKN